MAAGTPGGAEGWEPSGGPPAGAARSTPRRLLAAVLLLNLFVDGVMLVNLRQGWQQRQHQALRSADSLTRLLERTLEAVFDKVDLALLAVADEQARQAAAGRPDPAALDAALARQRARTPDLLTLAMADAGGHLVRGAPQVPAGLYVGDRDYFVAQRASDAGLFISRPVLGRLSKVPVIFFSRRLTGPEGRFAGVVSGAITLEHVASILADVEVGPHGATLLRYQDLSEVVRRANGVLEPLLGPSQVSATLRRQVAAGQTSGAYVAVAPADGISRTYGFRKIGGSPFYGLVGLAQEDLLRSWWREAAQAAGLAALFAAVTALGAWSALRSFRDRQAATEALRESESRLAAIIASFPAALAITDLETGRYLLANEAFGRTTGWPLAEVVGRTSGDIDVWTDRADRAAVIAAVTARGAVDDYEAVFRRRDGSRLTGLLSARTIAIEGRRYLLTITRDVTRQRQLEAQLQQAQRLESVGRLAGGVAHDFNNMLSVILGEAAILAADLPAGHPGHEGVREITRAGERSRDLTRQLLAFSRKQAISPRPVDLDTLVGATLPALVRLIGEDVALHFEPARDLRPVLLDPSQFDQVLVNLVVNARDAMPAGGRLVLRTANVTLAPGPGQGPEGLPPGAYAQLTVSDDGVGMDEETLSHLFEPFFTTKAAGKGTGLGLATSYGIVQQNGGAIQVRSAPGQGTTFTILLPCTGDRAEPAAAPAGPAPVRGEGLLLLVEDEAPVRRTTRRLLESLGYRVLEAGSGEEALALAEGTAFDLLVTDVMMPGMKGPELSQRLRARRPGLETLFISGYTASVIGSGGILEAGTHFLKKPFSVEDLALKLREALRARAAPPA